ncbi:MAG: DUF1109 domain-containing protein [Xanthobacteraceae bacterium]|nr:DUF1109 domain-containing protein [Xanthobacteraceae bacterium]
MKTDDLVALLSTNPEPVDRGLVVRTLLVALGAGSILSLGITIFGLGVRQDIMISGALSFVVAKVSFAVGIFSLAFIYLAKLARPGGERKPRSYLVAVPFLVIVALAVISLGLAPSSHWNKMIVGDEWLECLVSIPVVAILPFAVSIWAVRKAAPTNLVRAGAFAGLVAGGVSAMAYALHCTDDSLPFVAVWYGGTIVLCTLAGAAMGPRLLRW